MENQLLKKSGILAIAFTFILLAFWFGFAKLSLGAYNEKNLTRQFLAEDSEVFKTLVIEVGSDTVARIIAGTSSMTRTGTSSYPYQPRIQYDGVTGKWTFKNSGGTETVAFGTVSAAYVAAEIGSSAANYVLKINGSSTGQLATNPTFAGDGTITASFGANGLVVSPAEYSCVDGGTSPFQAQINAKQDSIGQTPLGSSVGSVTAALGSQSVNAFSDVNINMSNENDFVKIVGGQLVAGSSSVTIAFPEVTGSASASQLPLISGLFGSATSAQLPNILELYGTTTTIAGTSTTFRIQHFAGTETYANAELILKFNNPGTSVFLDSSDNYFTITASGEAIGTTTAQYGSGALYLDGSGNDYITIPDSPLFDATASEIITFWINPLALAGTTGLMVQDNGNGALDNNIDHWILLLTAGDLNWNVNGTGWNPGFTIPTSSYTFVELNYQDGVAYAFQGGTLLGTSTVNRPTGIAGNITWGKGYTGAPNYYNGLVDQFTWQRNAKGHTSSYTAPDYFLSKTLNFIPAGTVTASLSLGVHKTITGSNNTTALNVKINGAIDSTSDIFISFKDGSDVEQGNIACSGVANVVSYNSALLTHWSWIVDKTGLSAFDVVEMTGKTVGNWKGLDRTIWSEVEEPELDLGGNPIYEMGSSTTQVQKMKKISKKMNTVAEVEKHAQKNQLPVSKRCETAKSKAAWGIYMGTTDEGVDIIASTGTGFGKLINPGYDIEVGTLVCSSAFPGFLDAQEGIDGHTIMDYTIGQVSENVVWEASEQWRTISILLKK